MTGDAKLTWRDQPPEITIARTFHLSCNGPLDPSEESIKQLTRSLSRIIPDSRTVARLVAAGVGHPCKISTPGKTLAEARAMDSALMALGLFSEIFIVDSEHPNRPVRFLNQRQGPRREDAAQKALEERLEAATGSSLPPSAAPANNKRARKGRRSTDT